MDDVRTSIRRLLSRYIKTAAEVVAELRKECGQRDLLRAWRSKVLPQIGTISSGLKFSFHGCGCYFELGTVKIDIDFGPECRCDGFDAWRLSLFANENALGSNWTHENVSVELKGLEAAGLVFKPEWLPSPHLYYRTEVFSAN